MKAIRIIVTLCLALPFMLRAQQESLLIGPGDQIHVQVFDTPELDATARVDDKGDLPLLMGGTIHVAGFTPEQAAHALEQDLISRKIMYTPQVLITVLQYATQNVTVFGQVGRPAAYEISTPRPLTDVLTLAGGFTELADRHVTIEHRNGKGSETVFVSNNPKVDQGEKTLVYPGDRVTVPKQDLIYVLGDVNRAGGFPMNNSQSGITALQAVAAAGGTANTALANSARLIRRTDDGVAYKDIPLKLNAMQKGKVPDMTLEPNDVIYVPFSFLRNAALSITGLAASVGSAAVYAK